MRTFLLTAALMMTAAPALAQTNVSAPVPAKPATQKQTEAQLAAQRSDARAHKISDAQKAEQQRAKARADKIQQGKVDDQRKAAERTDRIAKTNEADAKHLADVRAAKLSEQKTEDQRKAAERSDRIAKIHSEESQHDASVRADALARSHAGGKHRTAAPVAESAATRRVDHLR